MHVKYGKLQYDRPRNRYAIKSFSQSAWYPAFSPVLRVHVRFCVCARVRVCVVLRFPVSARAVCVCACVRRVCVTVHSLSLAWLVDVVVV